MLRTCFQHLTSQNTLTLVWERYKKWGGIVRYVLAKPDAESQKLLEAALTAIDLEDLIFHLGALAIESDDKASHRLLHLKPVGEGELDFSDPYNVDSYMLDRTELASPYIKELIFKAMQQRHYERLNHVLAQPIINASYAKLYGDLYQIGATKKILEGGTFESFDCTTGTAVVGGITVPPSATCIFQNVENLSIMRSETSYQQGLPRTYIPSSSTFTAVDAILPNDALVNFTINVNHVAKMYGLGSKFNEGVGPVADALGIVDDIHFYWLLPEIRYKEACKTGKSFSVTGQRLDDKRIVKQFFVCVPFDFERR